MAENEEKRKYGYIHKVGEEISIHFLDGKVLRGKLLKVFVYEIILEVKRESKLVEVSVFKGAIKYIIWE